MLDVTCCSLARSRLISCWMASTAWLAVIPALTGSSAGDRCLCTAARKSEFQILRQVERLMQFLFAGETSQFECSHSWFFFLTGIQSTDQAPVSEQFPSSLAGQGGAALCWQCVYCSVTGDFTFTYRVDGENRGVKSLLTQHTYSVASVTLQSVTVNQGPQWHEVHNVSSLDPTQGFRPVGTSGRSVPAHINIYVFRDAVSLQLQN